MDPAFAWIVTWLRLTFNSFEFWSANGCWDCVSWNSPSVLCTWSPYFVVFGEDKVPWILLRRRSLVPVLAMLVAAPVAHAADPIMPLSEVKPGMRCKGL